jgi:hypothetical protein
MHEAVLMHKIYSRAGLDEVEEGMSFIETTLVSDNLEKCSFFCILHDQVNVFVVFNTAV